VSGAETVEDVWTEDFIVRDYEVDAAGRLSVLTLCHLMQEAASNHARARGMALAQLLTENYAWLLSRMLVRLTGYPAWGDRIRIETWPTGVDKLFALRDFRATNGQGLVFAAATSAWLILDTTTRRLTRVEQFLDRFVLDPDRRALPEKLLKLPRLKEADQERAFTVRYRDLDINQHVNNVSYLEWVLESLPFDLRKEARLAELEVNFLGEAFFGDQVLARWRPEDESGQAFRHCIVHEADGRELTRARTVWHGSGPRAADKTLDNHPPSEG